MKREERERSSPRNLSPGDFNTHPGDVECDLGTRGYCYSSTREYSAGVEHPTGGMVSEKRSLDPVGVG